MSTTNSEISAKNVIADFQKQILDLDSFLTEMSSNPDWGLEDVSETYFQISSMKNQMSVLVKQMENLLISKMSDVEAVSVSSGDMIIKEWSKTRKAWQHKELAHAVAERIQNLAIDMDTGERTMDTGQMIEALLDYVQPSYWRVTALSNIGLNADSYCQAGDSEPKIKIEKAK
jgi:hypothetical protein